MTDTSPHGTTQHSGLSDIRLKMSDAARKASRNLSDICLIGVCKRQPLERIYAARQAGLNDFGENRVDEAQQHWGELPAGITRPTLHMVGDVQSRKVADATALFDVVHSLAREKIARAFAKAEQDEGRRLAYFVQVNTGEEPQKGGISPKETPDFVRFAQQECGLDVCGLMCLPPVDEAAGLHFALLADLAAELGLAQLSMGMSGDFETAIQFGATHVRVGSALFGERG